MSPQIKKKKKISLDRRDDNNNKKKEKTTKESADNIHIIGNIGLVIQQIIIITAVCDHMYSIAIIVCIY
jgi:hypothetical protein